MPGWEQSSHEIAFPRGITLFLVPPEPHSCSIATHPGGFLKFVLLLWWEEDVCFFLVGEMLQQGAWKWAERCGWWPPAGSKPLFRGDGGNPISGAGRWSSYFRQNWTKIQPCLEGAGKAQWGKMSAYPPWPAHWSASGSVCQRSDL